MSGADPTVAKDVRSRLTQWVHHLEHVLPGQAPIRDFVHHNTLHGFQHLPFPQAIEAARHLTGARGYLPAQRFREFYAQGRIDRSDLEAALRAATGPAAAEVILQASWGSLALLDVQLVALLHAVDPITPAQLKWQTEELGALTRFQPAVGEQARQRLMRAAAGDGGAKEEQAIADLWSACIEVLGLDLDLRHPEELLEASPEVRDEDAYAEGARALEEEAAHLLDTLCDRLGRDWSARSLVCALTGEDVLDVLRPYLVRHLASHLDHGLAAWHNPLRERGFYAAWRGSARDDLAWLLSELPDLRREIGQLPQDALDAVMRELTRLGLDEERWEPYLERLALDLPGWSGMFLWRHLHPDYAGLREVPVGMMDYLAVRLVLERLFAEQVVQRCWGVALRLSELRDHFRRHPAELVVRHALQQRDLPEYLSNLIEGQIERDGDAASAPDAAAWEWLALRLKAWRETPATGDRPTAGRSAWPLFLAAQHLGLGGGDLRASGRPGADALLACLRQMDEERAGFVWLNAYERHYREQIFTAITANHERWQGHATTPEAQLVFCMDDREEGMRRHLEEINPRLETLGGAAHFGVFQNWRALDDREVTPLCPVVPVVVKPAHEVREEPRPGAEQTMAVHRRRHDLRRLWQERLHQGSRRALLAAPLLTAAGAPFALAGLVAKSLLPARLAAANARLRRAFERAVPTRIALTAAPDSPPATPESPRLGFTDDEQADRIFAYLTSLGLTRNFAPLVVIAGHGSNSQNNPHLAAYDCGACAGRHSGPNARLFAAMANRGEVRTRLRSRGIDIPDGTWFIGAEHNTCDDSMTWYDAEDIPAPLAAAFAKLDAELARASRAHAQERCRRFASAPPRPTPEQALRHVLARRDDFSQARPELGHATNACALFGRRALSRGAFFDRRAFLISYDPTQDPQGTVLERHLLINGAVGAGISLEYYFSTANNEQYGCGTKTMHNVAGLLGVMEGASSDLRTGLPRQMIEIHEAMRLLVIVEHKIEVITAIYQRQPPLQELIGNGWVIVAAKDPESPAIHLFDPAAGWLPWQGQARIPTVEGSADWFLGQSEPLAPALLTKPLEVTP